MNAEKLLARAAESGGPIIDPIRSDPARSKVTFVWNGAPETKSVVVQTQLVLAPDVAKMRRVKGGNVWTTTLVVDNDVTTAYQFVVDYRAPSPKNLMNLPFEKQMAQYVKRMPHMYADPNNPRTMRPQWFNDSMGPDRLESLLVMPYARPRPWSEARDGAHGVVEDHTITSTRMENERGVYVYLPPGYDESSVYPVVLLLDGMAWKHLIPAARIFDNLIASGSVPPFVSLFVDNATPTSRMTEMPCNPAFADFLADEVLPWARERWRITGDPSRTVIGGVSYGGLASGWAGFHRPDAFGLVLSMSGSYWWGMDADGEPEWLVRRYAETERKPLRWYQDVGRLESFGRIPMAPGSTMGSANRHLRTILRSKGYDVAYDEFPGGHEFSAWEDSLPRGLLTLLGS